jgi:outer membrane protein
VKALRRQLNQINMKNISNYIYKLLFLILTLAAVFFSAQANAETMLRIIGDKSTIAPNNPSKATIEPPPPATIQRATTIRIVGDTQYIPDSAAHTPMALPENIRISDAIKEIRLIGDKNNRPQTQVPESEQNRFPIAVDETPTNEISEQQLTQRLSAIKEEERRKFNEKVEQERQARIKAEQENEAIRQVALKAEQDQLAERMAMEARIALQKKLELKEAAAEVTRQAAIKLEQERVAAIEAEETRRAAEKAEKEKTAAEAAKLASSKREQERLAAIKAEESQRTAKKAEQEKAAADAAQLATSKQLQDYSDSFTSPMRGKNRRLIAGADNNVSTQEQAKFSVNSLSEVRTVARQGNRDFNAGSNAGLNKNKNSDSAPESIWDLYLSAKTTDPVLGRTLARVSGSKADSDVLLSGLMPHLDSTVGIKQISQTLTNYAPNEVTNDYTSLNYNVTARITLLHLPTIYSLSAAAANLKVEEAGVAAARQNLIVKFTDAYFSVLKAQTDKQIAEGEINRLRQVLNQSQAFLKAGTGDVISVYEARSRLDGAGADLTKSESTLRLAEQKLSSIIGKPLTSIVNYLPHQPSGPEPDDLDWWVATMENEQPIVRQAREGLAQTTEQKKAIKAEYLPIVQANGGYDVNRGTAALPTAEVRQWYVGATLTLPLYSGGETASKIRRATASEDERRYSLGETMDQQRENIKQAFFNLRYNISYIKALEQKKASAEIQLSAVSKGRKIGTRSAIDLLNAEQSYSIALKDYNYALYDNIIRLIQLKSAAGILDEADVSEISKIPAPFLISRR